MTDTNTDAFDQDQIAWVGLAVLTAQRDGITVDQASKNLEALMQRPDVIAEHQANQAAKQAETDRVAALETGKAEAEQKLQEAVAQVEQILDSLRDVFPDGGAVPTQLPA
jgi:hypothetical protein